MTITQVPPSPAGDGGHMAGGSQALTTGQLTHRIARAAMAAGRWAGRKITGLWRALPGPWWVKTGLLLICLAIPGPGDEIALLAVAGFLAARKVRAAR